MEIAQKSGARICLEYHYDDNQVLKLLMGLADGSVDPLMADIQNPLTHVVNPHGTRTRINDIEREIRHGGVSQDAMPWRLVDLAEEYAKLAHREKALAILRSALQRLNYGDPNILNRMAIICGEMGDHEREERLYREAARAPGWGGAWFNLALAQRAQKRHQEAIESAELAIESAVTGPYLALRGFLAGDVGDSDAKARYFGDAVETFGEPASLNDWELGWLLATAQSIGNSALTEQVKAEQRKRRKTGEAAVPSGGMLPELSPRVE